MNINSRTGFTLIEVMVVMALIAVLSVLVIGAISIARRTAAYTQATSEMKDLRGLMESYAIKYGELPPRKGTYSSSGDSCSGCYDPPQYWTSVINDMRDAGYFGQPIADQFYTDPWGTPYAYDDNLGQSGATLSLFCTAGPDGRRGNNGTGGYGTGDDKCMNITHEAKFLW
jgi:prepilin-type N-terminal cleavage/methylation domain-containing protein